MSWRLSTAVIALGQRAGLARCDPARSCRSTRDGCHAGPTSRPDGDRSLILDEVSDQSLDNVTEPVSAPGWAGPGSYPVRECLPILLNEKWEHHLDAARDLAILRARLADATMSNRVFL